MRRPRTRREGLTLVEIAVALGVLAVSVLGITAVLGGSVQLTRDTRPRMLAVQAAERILRELEAEGTPIGTMYQKFWGAPSAPLALVDAGTAGVYVDLDAYVPLGAPSGIHGNIIAPALSTGEMKAPSAGSVLRVRFLGEAEYDSIWGTSADLDLDGNLGEVGILNDGSGSTQGAGFVMYPVMISVHWSDQSGEQVFRLPAVVRARLSLDGDRS